MDGSFCAVVSTPNIFDNRPPMMSVEIEGAQDNESAIEGAKP